ncbi:hypothetical protein [Mycobacteroides abscessus]
MSLVFTKKSLIAAAENAIKNHNAAVLRWERDREKYLADHQAAWIETNLSKVKTLRTALTDLLKPGKIITLKQVRSIANSGNDIEYLFYTAPTDSKINSDVGFKPTSNMAHQGLVDLLKAHTGETITANQLKILGYDDLAGLFRDAVRAGGTI